MDELQEAQVSHETAGQEEILEYFIPDQARRSESDTTLSALAQLATLRLQTTQALISLIDDANQYILVEATQNSRLRSDSPYHYNDGFLLGRKTLARRLGLCGNALDILSPKGGGSSLPLIVNDIIDDERFKNRPFVTSHPSARFYAAMPIRGKLGSNIGAIEVIDERPREGLSEAEIEFLGDVALAIMAHLEMTRSQEGERRSEKMIKGLGVFMKGRTDLQDWWLELGNNKPRKQQDASAGGEPERKGRETEDCTSVSQGHALSSKHGTGEAAVSGPGASSLPFPDSNPSKATLAGFNAGFPVDRPLVSTPIEYTDATATSRPVSQKHLPKSAQSTQETTAGADAESPMPHRGHSASTTFTSDFQDSLISGRLKEMFCRAGHIIQESIEVDGALFLDASVSTLSERSGESSSTQDPRLHYESSPEQEFRTSTDGTSTEKEHSPTAEKSGPDSASNNNANQGSKETSTGRRSGEEVPCGILGLWTSEHSSLHGDRASTLRPLTESFLQSLLHKYPQGHVFSPVEQCAPPRTGRRHHFKESAERVEADTICRMLPGTRSIAFVPLWDQNTGRWFAGGFMWTALHTERVLTHARDLNYLAAFGNSIMAEVARLDVVGADRAKSDFISSISHELRSPLHGILASVELLHDTTVDLFQYGMIDTIERCGRTLLDTIQHVLDFAKINTFTRSKSDEAAEARPSGRPSLLGMPSLSVNIDLSLLVEDVVDSVFAGHEFQGNSSFLVTDGASGFPPKGLRRSRAIGTQSSRNRNEHGQKRERIDVVVDIVWRPNWIFSTESGALRRVLMNLFGNALKYTDRGCVKVSLQATDIEVSQGHRAKSIITLTVSDTGRGIDQEYLHNGLFTPFTQENPLNPGTGLGLSIVLQIVRSLGGKIDITSEVGVGTEVMVTFTMNQAPSSEPRHLDREGQTLIQSVRDKTKGLVIGLVGLDVEPSIPTRDPSVWQGDLKPSLFLHASIESAAREWFGMQATPPSTWQLSPPNIYVANEHPGALGAFGGVPTIVLCSHEELYREYSQESLQGGRRGKEELIHFVSKPCGPHKLAKAFAFCLANASNLSPRTTPGMVPGTLTSLQSFFSQYPEMTPNKDMDLSHSGDNYFTPVAKPTTVKSSTSTPPADKTNTSTEERQKPMLLLVEDNEINLRLLSHFVKKSGFTYDTAVNGFKALKAFQVAEKPYDMVIMDITMPVMDGIQATREIRKLEHARQQRPAMIIALTGLGSATTRKEAFDSGINMFLTKPVRFKDMREILDDWAPGMGTDICKF